MNVFTKILDFFFSMKTMVLLMLIYAVAIGRATFIEDNYDTPAAKIMVFHAVWFQMLNFVLAINLLGGMFKYKMFRKEKIGQFMFHIAFIFILLGAGITRYVGFEGSMQIREGEESNMMYSAEPYIQFKFFQANENSIAGFDTSGYKVAKWMSEPTQSHNSFEYDFDLKNKQTVKVMYNWYKTEAVYDVYDGNGEGEEILLMKYGRSPRDTFYIRSGSLRSRSEGLTYAFNNDSQTDAVQFKSDNKGEVQIKAPFEITVLDQDKAKNFKGEGRPPMDTLAIDEWHQLRPRVVHFIQGASFYYTGHFRDAKLGFRKQTQLEGEKKQGTGFLSVDVLYKGDRKTIIMEGKDHFIPTMGTAFFDDLLVQVGYGSIKREIPFKVGCKDFRLEKYKGSEAASSFESDLIINDGDEQYETTVFMNNVLDHKGYRFFQSSYSSSNEALSGTDGPDITVLSVNHDMGGTIVTYIGYILMAIGFIWSMFLKQSRFTYLIKQVRKLNAKRNKSTIKMLTLLVGLSSSATLMSQDQPEELSLGSEIITEIDADYTAQSKRLLIQTIEGRISPLQTHALDVLYKVYKKRSYEGMSAIEVYISMLANPYPWYSESIISVKNPQLRTLLGVEDGTVYAKLSDFLDTELFDEKKLQIRWEILERFNQSKITKDAEKNAFDKDIIKAMDQFEVLLNTLSGRMFRVYPTSDLPNGRWVALPEMIEYNGAQTAEIFQINQKYFNGLYLGVRDGDWQSAKDGLTGIIGFQKQYGGDALPSDTKVSIEIAYNDYNIFFYLLMIYTMLGFIFLVVIISGVSRDPSAAGRKTVNILKYILIFFMSCHVLGLAMRWYITNHAPWSNGYEALVFIAFVAVLASVLFSRISRYTLIAGPLLAGLILGVAHGANADPQLTNLVPVLKSYWLVIHVAIITGSYAFLGLGAVLSLINLSLYSIRGSKKNSRFTDAISEMSYVAELTMTVGLYMAAIGTFLGGVWANESWGRYWGWDAKETWALVIVIVYSLVLHTRFIPFLKKRVVFNALALLSFGTVIMTYFGVNYYLSKGLHSYARGAKTALPSWAIYTFILVVLLCIFAFIQNQRYEDKNIEQKES